MNIISIIWIPPVVELRMPKESEPTVEETCTFPFRGFVMSLCYNLLLIIICSFYAFKTRKLPDNFNESRYIALSVYTTLVIWTVFLPSYFVNNRAFHQVILLTSATLLNGTVNLMCLYIPKIYATLGSDSNIKFSYKTPSTTNSHELAKCMSTLSQNCNLKMARTASGCILHNSNSKPSLDGSTKRQSVSDSDEGSDHIIKVHSEKNSPT